MSLSQRLRKVFKGIWNNVYTLNFFKSATTQSNSFDRRTQLITTRVYLVLLCTSIVTLFIYNSSNVETRTFLVKTPSLTMYENLYEKYSSTLSCLCNQIAIEYGQFISLEPNFHPVCSSTFVQEAWIIASQGSFYGAGAVNFEDFRGFAPAFFATLASLCSLSESTIIDDWQVFNESVLITSQLLGEKEFILRSNSALNQFQLDTIGQYKRTFALIQTVTDSSFSSAQTNTYLSRNPFINFGSGEYFFNSIPKEMDQCSCTLSNECQSPVSFYTYDNSRNISGRVVKFTVPNLLISCSIIQALRVSTLQCFFNQTCFDIILSETDSPYSINISILQRNLTRFTPETPLGNIIDELMVESWGKNISYSKYYGSCQPKLCTYTISSRNNVLYVLTALLGLVGGLSAAFRILLPVIVAFICNAFLFRNTRNRVSSK